MRTSRLLILGLAVGAGASLSACGSITSVSVDAAGGSGGNAGSGGNTGSGGNAGSGGVAGAGGAGGGATGGVVGSGGAMGGSTGTGGAAGGSTGTGGVVGSGGAGGGNMLPCPPMPAADGSPCFRDGLVCEYGDDPRADRCNTFARCSGNRWMITEPNRMTCPPLTDAGMCNVDDAQKECQPADSACRMRDGRSCHCTNCVDYPVRRCLGPNTWHCPAANTVAGCPAAAPQIGSVCLRDGATCDYGCGYAIRKCERGIWVPAGESPCPISTRKAKQNIQYLSPSEIRALASEVLKMKLAQYEYRDRPFAGRKHLGFIIEDSPGVPAVDRDHDMVDLYGYTSMLLAATQQQQREIDDLKAQLAALREQVRAASAGRKTPARGSASWR